MTTPFNDPSCGSGPSAKPVPYVLGTARGVRAFEVDNTGRLRGVTYPQVWHEGENIAQCYVTDYFTDIHLPTGWWAFGGVVKSVTGNGRATVGGVIFPEGDAAPEAEPGYAFRPCNGVERKCTCGFYAYHTNLEAYYNHDRAFGVIEAYGRVVLGPKGFRAQRARIIGLVPPYAGRDLDREAQALQDRLDAINTALATVPNAFKLARTTKGIMCIAAGIAVCTFIRPVQMFYAGMIAGCVTGLAVVAETHVRAALRIFQRAMIAARDETTKAILDLRQDRVWAAQERVRAMRLRYPNIPIYESVQELLERCPTTNLGYLADPKQEHPNS